MYHPQLPREVSAGIAWKISSQDPSLLSSVSLPLLQSLRASWVQEGGEGEGGVEEKEDDSQETQSSPSPSLSSFQVHPIASCLMGQEGGKVKGEEERGRNTSLLTTRFYWNTKAEIAELAGASEAEFSGSSSWWDKPSTIGDQQQEQHRKQFGLLNQYFLANNEEKLGPVHHQQRLLTKLTEIAVGVKSYKGLRRDGELRLKLSQLKGVDGFSFPFSPCDFTAKKLVLDKCKTLDSARAPLWLTFSSSSSSPSTPPPQKSIILKVGDDCRQDMFCLDLLQMLNGIWKEDRLPLSLTSYSCQVIGEMIAVIQVVPNCCTLAAINKQAGGALKVFSQDVLLDWLKRMNPLPDELEKAKRRFMVSCAGYCVFTFLFGIADRHNDNMMMSEDGRLVHIDYGHFLGNYKHRLGVNRERSPFVFTPQMMGVIGEEESPEFLEFTELCANGYVSAKKHFYLFVELFRLMSYAGLPELQSLDDAQYLWKAFSPEIADEEAKTKMREMVKLSVRAWSRQVDDALHILAH